MGRYTLADVISRWERGKLSSEQTIGQMLLHLNALSDRVGALEKQMEVRRNGKPRPAADSISGE